MAMIVREGCSAAAYEAAPQYVPQNPQIARLMERYEADRHAALELIGSLRGRIRQLERNLSQERLNRSDDAERHERELFDLAEAVAELNGQLQQQTREMNQRREQVRAFEERNGDNSATIQGLRGEVAALTNQVAQGRGQVEQLNRQFQEVMNTNRILTVRLGQVVVQPPQEDCSFLGKLQAAFGNIFMRNKYK